MRAGYFKDGDSAWTLFQLWRGEKKTCNYYIIANLILFEKTLALRLVSECVKVD